MKGLFALLIATTACVPASDPAPPRGAAGIHLTPSDASRGAPFTTDDGWQVTVTDFALRAFVTASPIAVTERFTGGSAPYLWNARDEVDIFAPGLGLGTWSVGYQLQGAYLEAGNSREDVIDLGVDPRIAARFRQPAPFASNPYGSVYQNGPFAVVVARGSKAGRTVAIDLALGSYRSGSDLPTDAEVTVRQDALSSSRLTLDATKLFVGDDGASTFQPVADADTDGNGIATADELAAIEVPCARCVQNGGEIGSLGTLLDVLGARVSTTSRP